MSETPSPPTKRRWWQLQPMDDHGRRTMLRGFLISGPLYLIGAILMFTSDSPTLRNVGNVLIMLSILTIVFWWIAVRNGFRTGRTKGRAERRAQEHARQEREKARRLNR